MGNKSSKSVTITPEAADKDAPVAAEGAGKVEKIEDVDHKPQPNGDSPKETDEAELNSSVKRTYDTLKRIFTAGTGTLRKAATSSTEAAQAPTAETENEKDAEQEKVSQAVTPDESAGGDATATIASPATPDADKTIESAEVVTAASPTTETAELNESKTVSEAGESAKKKKKKFSFRAFSFNKKDKQKPDKKKDEKTNGEPEKVVEEVKEEATGILSAVEGAAAAVADAAKNGAAEVAEKVTEVKEAVKEALAENGHAEEVAAPAAVIEAPAPAVTKVEVPVVVENGAKENGLHENGHIENGQNGEAEPAKLNGDAEHTPEKSEGKIPEKAAALVSPPAPVEVTAE